MSIISFNNDSPYIGIRDITRLANVSTATVSCVINHPEQTSPQIRARVKAVIDQQHYVPNQTVKKLFACHSDSIALFVSDISNPFYISLLQELNQLAFANKHTLLICNTSNNAQKEQDYLDYCATIQQNIPAIAETLFKLCLQPPTPPRHITIPTEFIPGQTCGFCRKKI